MSPEGEPPPVPVKETSNTRKEKAPVPNVYIVPAQTCVYPVDGGMGFTDVPVESLRLWYSEGRPVKIRGYNGYKIIKLPEGKDSVTIAYDTYRRELHVGTRFGVPASCLRQKYREVEVPQK